MTLSAGERVELKKRVTVTLAELMDKEPLMVDLILEEYDFPTEDRWNGSSEGYVLAAMRGRDKDEQLQALDYHLHPPVVGLGADTAENTQFTPDEQQEIATQLGELKIHVEQTYSLSGEQIRLLEAQMGYLEDAASRMGRIDWRNAAAGVFLGAIVNTVLPGNATRDALVMLFRSIGHMFGHPTLELLPVPRPRF
jgi:hypothetical protein